MIRDLRRAGFVEEPGKGSHRNFHHPHVSDVVTVSGNSGDDARYYQEKKVRNAISESKRS